MILAQGLNPQGQGLWTVVVGRNEAALTDGLAAVADVPVWRSLTGQLTAYQLSTQRVDSRAALEVIFIETRPFSITNWRQIFANWLSGNMIFYAAALLGLCTVLGIVTSFMLKGLGRR